MSSRTMKSLLLLVTAMILRADDDPEYIKRGKVGNQVDRVTLTAAPECDKETYFDVLDSLLVAQHAADHKYGPNGIYDNTEKWYKFYTVALKSMGWIMGDLDFQDVGTQDKGFTMDKAIIEMMEGLLAGEVNEIAAAKGVLDALKSLAKDGKISIFSDLEEHNDNGHWQIGVCHQDRMGAANLSLGCMRFHLKHNDTNFLFWEYKVTDMSLFTAKSQMVLDPHRWAAMKGDITKKFINNQANKDYEEKNVLDLDGLADESQTMSFTATETTRLCVDNIAMDSFCSHLEASMQK